MEPLVFDLEPIEIPVTIKGKDKIVRNYILCEASEAAASRYTNAQLKATKMVEGADGSKVGSVDGLSDTEALLTSLCLFELTENGGRKTVELSFVRGLPHRISEPLFKKAEEISGLNSEQTEEQLKKKIKELQGKLVKLKNESKEETEKNSSSAIQDISG